MKSRTATSHIAVLAHCLVKLPPRSGVSFVESRLPNELGYYEMAFRDDRSGDIESINVPKEMVYAAIASRDNSELMAHISARYAALFRKSILGENAGQDQVFPA